MSEFARILALFVLLCSLTLASLLSLLVLDSIALVLLTLPYCIALVIALSNRRQQIKAQCTVNLIGRPHSASHRPRLDRSH